MSPKKYVLAVCVALVAWLGLTGSALAAGAPGVTIQSATKVTNNSATLRSEINPNGAKTSYLYNYGPSTALGTRTAQKTLAAGTKPKAANVPVTGLTPGTTYYFQVQASNAAGAVTTKTLSFTTKGTAPAVPTTGGAQGISTNGAQLTGTINPQGKPTRYWFKYGTSPTSLTSSTTPQMLNTTAPIGAPAPKTAVPISPYQLSGLAAGTVFYYQLWAQNTDGTQASSSVQSFETYPSPAPVPPVGAVTSPGETHYNPPFTFLTNGHVRYQGPSPQLAPVCTGSVFVTYHHGRQRVFGQTVPLSTGCTFASKVTFRHTRHEHITVYAHFNGNGYMKPHDARPQVITLH
ncbi:MAG: fibronectin type III domain-containing protein [Solirubrobacterales bacterium]|nr:fibronectin type III domain-containing protein [Solirubrobacterales bacterium]